MDFSSTKYNEEIRNIFTQKGSSEKVVAVSSDQMLSTDVYTIGEAHSENGSERLTTVLKKVEEWATPFECYRIAVMEQKSKEEAEVTLFNSFTEIEI